MARRAPATPTPAPADPNQGFRPQELAGFGFPLSTAAPPTPAPASPANPNHGFTPQELAAVGFPPEAAPRPQPGGEFTPTEVLQFDDAGQITPEAAAAVAAAFQPRSEFSTTEVPQFGDVGPAALSEIDIQRAFAQAEAERLAFERNFGPIVEQEQLAEAQRQFNQDFGPLAEQEIADTRNRQRAQFEQDFGRFEAEAEQERLTEERRAREQFEREYNVGQRRNLTAEQIAQERADAEGFMVGGKRWRGPVWAIGIRLGDLAKQHWLQLQRAS